VALTNNVFHRDSPSLRLPRHARALANCTALVRFPRQIARAKAVKAEFVRQAEHASKEGRKAADILAEGAIVGVGLIQRDKSS
jgi:hypothetical protein